MRKGRFEILILGIDPGLATIGFGVVDYTKNRFTTVEYGAVLTPAGAPIPDRLSEIYDGIGELCEKFRPDAVSIEELFFNDNAKTAVNVCQARGVILLSAKKHGIPIFEYTPLQIKQAVTGYGRAEKQQVMYMVKSLLGLKSTPRPDDTADALAAAICHGYSAGSRLFELT